MDHNTRIVISANADDIKKVIAELEKLRSTDEKTSIQFEKNHKKRKDHHKEELKLSEELKESFDELGQKIASAFALESIIEFGEECIKEFNAAQEVTKQLEFAITSLAKGSKKDFSEMIEQSELLSNNFNNLFSPKQIQEAQTKLLQYGFTAEQAFKLTPRLIDIAAQKNISLAEASQRLGLAIEGNKKGLRELGIDVNITGDSIKDLNNVMVASEKYAGGAAKAMEEVASKEQQAANKAEILKETLGKQLAPAFENLKLMALTSLEAIIGGIERLFVASDESSHELKKWGLNTEEIKKLIDAGITPSLSNWEKGNEKVINSLKDTIEILDSGRKALRDHKSGTEDYNKTINALVNDTKKFNLSTEEGRIKLKLYTQAIRDLKEDLIKGGEEESKGIFNLTKITDDQLNERLQATVEHNGDLINEQNKTQNVLQHLIGKGFEAEGERIKKEIERRQKANDDLLKLQENYQRDLDAIKKRDADDFAKFTIDAIEDETKKKLAQQDEAFRKESVEFDDREKKLLEIIKKGRKDQREAAMKELQNLYIDERLADEANDKIKAKIQADADKKAKDEAMKSEIEKSELKFKFGEIENKKELVNGKKNQEQYEKQQKELHIAELEDKLAIEKKYGVEDIKLQQEIELAKLDLVKSSSDKTKKFIENIQSFTNQITQALQETIESNISALDTMAQRQSQRIDQQKILAEKGLANDLAFEEKRADEIEKKKLQEQRKLRKAKELETFLNSLAKFAEDNPNTAIAKALGVLAASKAVEAIYMEEGGIMGQTNQYSALGAFSRRHRSGNDLLIHGERGEGVIPVNKMKEWGLTSQSVFSNFLRNPLSTIPIPQPKLAVINNNSDLIAEVKEMKDYIKNMPHFSMDVNKLHEWVTTETRNGIKTITTHKRKLI